MRALSNRLLTIAKLVQKGSRVADIGTDHGYLPIYLSQNGICEYVFACDINEKPLESARRNIDAANIKNICLRLSDGLNEIRPNEIDTAIIAGIGGEVIAGIIKRCEWLKCDRYTLILQPTTSPEKLREGLTALGFTVITERAVKENGKLYSIMLAKFTGNTAPLPAHELYIGKLTPTDTAATDYITKQLKRVSTLAHDLEGIPEKQGQAKYYLSVSKAIQALLGGN